MLKVKVVQSFPTFCDPVDHSPRNSPGQNTVVDSHSLLQGDLPNPGSNPGLLHYGQILYQLSHQGSPINTGVGSLSLLQWLFPIQESNWGLLHCRQIVYQLSYLLAELIFRGPMEDSSHSGLGSGYRLWSVWGSHSGKLFIYALILSVNTSIFPMPLSGPQMDGNKEAGGCPLGTSFWSLCPELCQSQGRRTPSAQLPLPDPPASLPCPGYSAQVHCLCFCQLSGSRPREPLLPVSCCWKRQQEQG